MNDMNPCGTHEALIAYLYDECEPSERESIAAHVALCALCTDEIQSLRDTRAHLGAWSPPSIALGFQITRTEVDQPAKVLRPAAWFRQPLPAWAQVAAAAVIFAAGMGVSAVRSTDAPAVASVGQPGVSVTPVAATTVSRNELARLDARIRSVETAQAQAVPVHLQRTAAPVIDEGALFARVSALVDERVAQSQRQNLRLIASVENRLDDTRGAMEEELLTYRQDIRRALPSLAVRASLQTGGGR
jgi:hypothetical protein